MKVLKLNSTCTGLEASIIYARTLASNDMRHDEYTFIFLLRQRSIFIIARTTLLCPKLPSNKKREVASPGLTDEVMKNCFRYSVFI